MPRLPQILPKNLRNALIKFGFEERSDNGSHRVFVHPDGRRTILAIHPKPISKGVLGSILKQTQLAIEEILTEL